MVDRIQCLSIYVTLYPIPPLLQLLQLVCIIIIIIIIVLVIVTLMRERPPIPTTSHPMAMTKTMQARETKTMQARETMHARERDNACKQERQCMHASKRDNACMQERGREEEGKSRVDPACCCPRCMVDHSPAVYTYFLFDLLVLVDIVIAVVVSIILVLVSPNNKDTNNKTRRHRLTVMAKEGPAVGIDLGTTYSCVGIWCVVSLLLLLLFIVMVRW